MHSSLCAQSGSTAATNDLSCSDEMRVYRDEGGEDEQQRAGFELAELAREQLLSEDAPSRTDTDDVIPPTPHIVCSLSMCLSFCTFDFYIYCIISFQDQKPSVSPSKLGIRCSLRCCLSQKYSIYQQKYCSSLLLAATDSVGNGTRAKQSDDWFSRLLSTASSQSQNSSSSSTSSAASSAARSTAAQPQTVPAPSEAWQQALAAAAAAAAAYASSQNSLFVCTPPIEPSINITQRVLSASPVSLRF